MSLKNLEATTGFEPVNSGFGKASIVNNFKEKSEALDTIIKHYGADYYNFSEDALERVNIIKIEISSITGKKSWLLS